MKLNKTPLVIMSLALIFLLVGNPFSITGVDSSASVVKAPYTLERSGRIYDGCQLSTSPSLQYPNVYACEDNVFYTCILGTYDCDPTCTYFQYQVSSSCGINQECVVTPEYKGCKDLPTPEPEPTPEPVPEPVKELGLIDSILLSFNAFKEWITLMLGGVI